MKQDLENFSKNFAAVRKEIQKSIVGLDSVIDLSLAALFAGGHVLLEGAPGLGKTLLVKSIAKSLGLGFKRIQFTADLMPSDITGTQIISEDAHGKKSFAFNHGPIFSNIILADEVNRAGPKTQSAILEAMEEKQVSVLGTTYKLPTPFFVLATQNPIELEGTYPLPEAQLDRFIAKVLVPSPSSEELKEILARTTGQVGFEPEAVFSEAEGSRAIESMRQTVRSVATAPAIEEVLVGIIFSLDPANKSCPEVVSQYLRFGPGPRGAQAVLLLAKVFALLDSRINVSYEDIKRALIPALRHRLILNYQADADGICADEIIAQVSNV